MTPETKTKADTASKILAHRNELIQNEKKNTEKIANDAMSIVRGELSTTVKSLEQANQSIKLTLKQNSILLEQQIASLTSQLSKSTKAHKTSMEKVQNSADRKLEKKQELADRKLKKMRTKNKHQKWGLMTQGVVLFVLTLIVVL